MFAIDTLVDHNAKTIKQAFSSIPNDQIRNGAEAIVDAQATYAKAVFAATSEIGKSFADAAIAYFPKQTVAKK